MSKGTVFRLAIHNADLDLVTPHWTFTCVKTSVNVSPHGIASALKASAHTETGYCQFKYHKHFAERNADVIDIAMDKWRIEEWHYDKDEPSCEWLCVVFPLSAATKSRSQLDPGKDIKLLDARDTDVTIRLLFVAPDASVPSSTLWSHKLTNSVRFCLVIRYGKVPIPHIPPAPVRFFDGHTPEALGREGARGLILCDLKNVPCLYNVG